MKKKILIISIIALVITLIGSTYAFFMYSKTTRAFTLTSGDIQIQFVNGENKINLTYAYPISDNYAKANLERLGYVDFSINGNITEDKQVINYEIYLEEDSKNTLDSDYIKVYLTDDTNKEIVSPITYNSLDKTSYANSKNGKVIYKVSKKGEFNDKYRIYVWIDSSYTQNVIQQRFSFKVNLYAYNDTETAVSVVKSKLVKYADSSKDDFQGGLVAVNTEGELYNETNPSETIREYRYSGPNVNNYVTFNDETWRIIGVFTDESGEEHLKIVRNEILSDIFPETYQVGAIIYDIKGSINNKFAYWNKNNSEKNNNDWATAGIQYWLNSENDDTNNIGYLGKINVTAKSMIEEKTKYYLGTITTSQNVDTTINSYFHEREVNNCQILVNNNPTNGCRLWNNNYGNGYWKGMIGLLYPSDYGYTSLNSYWNNLTLNNFNVASNTSWIKTTANHLHQEHLISPSNDSSIFIAGFSHTYIIQNFDAFSEAGIRPTLYLKSNVKIVLGTGEENNPYILNQ